MAINDEYLKAIIYGGTGVGKTTLCVTAEDYGHTLYIDPENSAKYAKRKYPSMLHIVPESFIELNKIYTQLFEHLKLVRRLKGTDGATAKSTIENQLVAIERYFSGDITRTTWKEIKFVIIDSGTKAQELAMEHIKPNVDMMLPQRLQIQDWQTNLDMVKLLFNFMNKLPIHVIFTALEEFKENDLGVIQTQPLFQGAKTSELLCSKVDLVGYMTIVKVGAEQKRKLQFMKTNSIVAKDRSDLLGKEIYDATIKKMMDKIYG